MFSNPWLDFSCEQVRPLKLGSFSTVAVHKDDLGFLSKPPVNSEWETPPYCQTLAAASGTAPWQRHLWNLPEVLLHNLAVPQLLLDPLQLSFQGRVAEGNTVSLILTFPVELWGNSAIPGAHGSQICTHSF